MKNINKFEPVNNDALNSKVHYTRLKHTDSNKLQAVLMIVLPFLTSNSYAGVQPQTTYTQSISFSDYSVEAKGNPQGPSFELPELSEGGRFIEQNRHKALGEWSLRQLNANARMLDDPWSQSMLESLAWQINAQARQHAPLALVVVNNPSINAFAIPGGVMGINTGTVLAANSIDEVASVIAHEVAHLSQRHYEHRDEASRKALLLQVGGLLAAIAASMADGDAAAAIMMGSQTAAMDSQMSFSRSNEREADRIGMQLMAKSGYDPRAMPRFFSTLNKKSHLNMSKQAFLPSFIMTHPLSSERLSEAQSRANRYKTTHFSKLYGQDDFELLKWRTKVLTKQTNEAELFSAAQSSKGAQLALAYWYGTQGRYSDCERILNKLKKSLGNSSLDSKAIHQSSVEILLAITRAQVSGMRGEWQQAEMILKPYYQLYPERQDLRLYIADIWLQLGKPTEVLASLKPMMHNRPHDVAILSRMQHAYEVMAAQNSDSDTMMARIATINALRYRAQGELWNGKYNDALVSLKQAKTLSEGSINKSTDSKIMSNSGAYNLRPLLANIDNEIEAVKMARDFRP